MNSAFNLEKRIVIFGIPFLMIGAIYLLARSSYFSLNPNLLSIGISFDLILTIPIVYFFLIRKTSIPKTTMIPILIVGLVMGTLILPPENQSYLNLFKTWILPIIELSVFSFVIYKVWKTVKGYKQNLSSNNDFYTTLKITCQDFLPKGTVIPVVTEIAVFYYGFIDWKKRELNTNEFSYHKESGTVGLLIAVLFLVVIETLVFHILISIWSPLIAMIFTFLSIYSGFQLFGFLKSLYKRPILLTENKLYLRNGIMSETTIDLAKIDFLEVTSKDLKFDNETRRLSILGELESFNLIIHLKEENILSGLYGIKRSYKNLAIHVDEKDLFVEKLTSAIRSFS